jgi:hypothetical protein
VVDNLNDNGAGMGLNGDLRYCIANAVDGDVITFGVTGTIFSGELDLAHSINIKGPGANLLTVRRYGDDFGPYVRIFTVLPGATISISGLTVANGYALDFGGGIANFGTLTLDNTAIVGNTADSCPSSCGWGTPASGGGIRNSGTLTINDSTISGNSAEHDGGGIANGDEYDEHGGSVTVNNSTISGNRAVFDDGGGIYSNNHNGATLTISNSSIAGNASSYLGAGGGIRIVTVSGLVMRNTIIARNSAAYFPDLAGHLTSSGYNLIGNTQGGSGFDATDLLNIDPLLGPLQDNGGPTSTMAVGVGSPALNAGDPAQLGIPDQRGVVRKGGVNIGAYQASASAFVLSAPATVTPGTPFDVTVTAMDPFGQVALAYTGTVTFSTSDRDPNVVLPADYTFTASDQGTHTFSGGFTLITPGDQTITATDTADNTIVGSATVTVTGGGNEPGSHRGGDSIDALFALLAREWSRPGHQNGSLAF